MISKVMISFSEYETRYQRAVINYNGVVLSLRFIIIKQIHGLADVATSISTIRGAAYIVVMKAIHSLIHRAVFVGVRH